MTCIRGKPQAGRQAGISKPPVCRLGECVSSTAGRILHNRKRVTVFFERNIGLRSNNRDVLWVCPKWPTRITEREGKSDGMNNKLSRKDELAAIRSTWEAQRLTRLIVTLRANTGALFESG